MTVTVRMETPVLTPFRPPTWLRDPHAQTVLAVYFPGTRSAGSAWWRPDTECHRLVLPDGDQIFLHDDSPPDWSPGSRGALLMHGAGGAHDSPYLVRTARKLVAAGIRVWRMDQRGRGAGQGLSRGPGHAGRSEDLELAVEHIAELSAGSPLTIIGFSLGGNILLKYLGECAHRFHDHVEKAIAVAPPIDLQYCAENLHRGLNQIYSWQFAKDLFRLAKSSWPDREPFRRMARRPRTLVEFDDLFTAPLSGYANAAEYYQHASSIHVLDQISIPTAIITAADDPMIPVEMFERARLSPQIAVCVTEHGGHLGYLGKRGADPDRRWLDWRIVDLVRHWLP